MQRRTRQVPADKDLLHDIEYVNACGPIACFVACRAMGREVSIAQLANDCGWIEGRFTKLSEMQSALTRVPGIVSLPTRLSPEQLRSLLGSGNYAAVLPIRKSSDDINHAVCAIEASERGIVYIDYPELRNDVPIDQLADIWDGQVLLVSRRSASVIGQIVALVAPGGLVGCLAIGLLRLLSQRFQTARDRSVRAALE